MIAVFIVARPCFSAVEARVRLRFNIIFIHVLYICGTSVYESFFGVTRHRSLRIKCFHDFGLWHLDIQGSDFGFWWGGWPLGM